MRRSLTQTKRRLFSCTQNCLVTVRRSLTQTKRRLFSCIQNCLYVTCGTISDGEISKSALRCNGSINRRNAWTCNERWNVGRPKLATSCCWDQLIVHSQVQQWTALYVRTASLYSMPCLTSSQCSCCRTGTSDGLPISGVLRDSGLECDVLL